MKGIYVGRFNEDELRNKEDKKAIEKAMKETGLRYINSKDVKKKGKVVALDVWVCSLEDCEDFN